MTTRNRTLVVGTRIERELVGEVDCPTPVPVTGAVCTPMEPGVARRRRCRLPTAFTSFSIPEKLWSTNWHLNAP